jgi:type IV pilus assembly protein PilN
VIRINLAPPRERQSTVRFRMPSVNNLGVLFLVIYVAVVSGITLYWGRLYHEEARLTGEIAKASAEIERLRPITTQAAKVKEQLADLQSRVKTIEDLTKDQARSIKVLNAFSNTVPNDLWITRMEEKSSMLKVSGTAFSALAVSDLMTNLRASGKFKDIEMVIHRQDLQKSPRVVTFEVTCRFEG